MPVQKRQDWHYQPAGVPGGGAAAGDELALALHGHPRSSTVLHISAQMAHDTVCITALFQMAAMLGYKREALSWTAQLRQQCSGGYQTLHLPRSLGDCVPAA